MEEGMFSDSKINPMQNENSSMLSLLECLREPVKRKRNWAMSLEESDVLEEIVTYLVAKRMRRAEETPGPLVPNLRDCMRFLDQSLMASEAPRNLQGCPPMVQAPAPWWIKSYPEHVMVHQHHQIHQP
jgi:hypothetical protein